MRMISRYRLEQELGRGGMGRVHRAFDTTLDRIVVLKLLAPELVADKGSRERFLREARLASALDHPNICTIYEIAEADGQYFIAMQYVPGKTLKRLVGGQPLSLDTFLSIALQTGDALASAHARGIVHRDIKSSNIIITPRGQVKVLDFGLAKLVIDRERAASTTSAEAELTQVGSPLGTPSYMSPEQARCERVDHRSDIFSFGVVLYEMATGHLPFRGASHVETMNAVISQPHQPIVERNKKIPPQIAAVIDLALAKRPSDRYQSMQQMLEELRQAALVTRVTQSLPDGVRVPYIKPRRQTFFGAFGRWLDRLSKKDASFGALPGPTATAERESSREDFSLTSGAPKRLAVIPFRNLSGDRATDFYGLSIADNLITEMARLRSLAVKPSSSVAKYHNQAIDPAQLGRELDVDIILTGNFLKAADRLRVTAQLIDASGGTILWSEKIDADAEDALAIQDRISKRIVSGLAHQPVTVDPVELLRDDNEQVRLDAVRMLGFSHDPRALSALLEALRDPSLKVKAEAVQAIMKLGEQATGPVIRLLTDALDEGDKMTARFSAKALGLIGDRSISSVLVELLRSDDTFVACEAILALGRLGESRAVADLMRLLDHHSGNIRFAVADALGHICDPQAYEALQNRLRDEDDGVRAKARWALSRLKQTGAHAMSTSAP